MKLVYRIFSELFLLISPVIILYRILKKKENKHRFLERYGFNSELKKRGNLIWFHCSSVGELLSIVPLIEKFEENKKISQILVTTTTLSSSKIFKSLKLKKTVHQFFPIDNTLIINKFLNYWKPTVCFLCESEIWPNFIFSINKRNIKLILINARMTLKSYSRWIYIKNYSSQIFKKFNICFTQNNLTRNRLNLLGAKITEIPFILRYDRKQSKSKMIGSITTLGYVIMVIMYYWPFDGWLVYSKKLKKRIYS